MRFVRGLNVERRRRLSRGGVWRYLIFKVRYFFLLYLKIGYLFGEKFKLIFC